MRFKPCHGNSFLFNFINYHHQKRFIIKEYDYERFIYVNKVLFNNETMDYVFNILHKNLSSGEPIQSSCRQIPLIFEFQNAEWCLQMS